MNCSKLSAFEHIFCAGSLNKLLCSFSIHAEPGEPGNPGYDGMFGRQGLPGAKGAPGDYGDNGQQGNDRIQFSISYAQFLDWNPPSIDH